MIKYDFKCEICQAKFDCDTNIPKVLQCGHTICCKCLERMKSKNISKCPFDRKIIDPDDDKIAINYYILHLIDGSIKESITEIEEKEEVFELTPKPVVNSPGWKNTLDGFIHGDILYTVESNGFIYCTDTNTGEWWFLYLNVFFGKFFFKNCKDEKNFFPKMYMIDLYGNLFQMFNKNYYTQLGKKGSWRNTSFVTVYKNKMYNLETSDKLYETDLTTGEWREISEDLAIRNNLKRINSSDENSRMLDFSGPLLENGFGNENNLINSNNSENNNINNIDDSEDEDNNLVIYNNSGNNENNGNNGNNNIINNINNNNLNANIDNLININNEESNIINNQENLQGFNSSPSELEDINLSNTNNNNIYSNDENLSKKYFY